MQIPSVYPNINYDMAKALIAEKDFTSKELLSELHDKTQEKEKLESPVVIKLPDSNDQTVVIVESTTQHKKIKLLRELAESIYRIMYALEQDMDEKQDGYEDFKYESGIRQGLKHSQSLIESKISEIKLEK